MTKKDKKYFFYLLVTIFLTLGFSISLQPLLADWIEPNAPPPQENLGVPIWNVSGFSSWYLLDKRTVIGDDFGVYDNGVDHFFVNTFDTIPHIGIGTSSPEVELHINSLSGETNGLGDCTSAFCDERDYTSFRIENTNGLDSIWELMAHHCEDAGGPGSQYYCANNNSFSMWGGEEGSEDYRFSLQGHGFTQTKFVIGHIDNMRTYHTATSVDIFGGPLNDVHIRTTAPSTDYLQFNIEGDYAEMRWGDDDYDITDPPYEGTRFRMIWDDDPDYGAGNEVEILTIAPYGPPTNKGMLGINEDDPDEYETFTVNGSISAIGALQPYVSDRRLKDINGEYTKGLDEILGLNPVYYNFKKDNPLNINSSVEHIGLIAQDLEDIIPEAVIERDNGYKTYNTEPINWALVNAIKEIAGAICVEDPGNAICD